MRSVAENLIRASMSSVDIWRAIERLEAQGWNEYGTLLTLDEYGRCQLPKKAERVWGKPGKTDIVGHYINTRTGEVESVAYRLPEPKKAAKPTTGAAVRRARPGPRVGLVVARTTATRRPRSRPGVTRKGIAMIGDPRTDALHQALADTPIEDETLLGLLMLAFGCDNVSVDSGGDMRGGDRRAQRDRQAICRAGRADAPCPASPPRMRAV
jgi:ParB family chromosome partitioning protein